ncbi:MAG: cupin domain-containing protein [Rhodospirillales bacterium]
MGGRIRTLRKEAGLTLAQLSERTGLSVGYLSQIERDLSHPSIRALSDIAKVFKVNMGWLFQTPDPARNQEASYVVRRDERGTMNLTRGIREEVLSPDLDGPLKLFVTTLQPDAESGPEQTSHKGVEAGLVISGELMLVLDDKRYRLREGDSFSFPSRVSHRFYNEGRQPVTVVWSMAVDGGD